MTPLFGSGPPEDLLREAAWVARCVGRAETIPLGDDDLDKLASYLSRKEFARGALLFPAGEPAGGVWIVRSGAVELSAGSGRRRVVVSVLHPGDIEGDISLILDRRPPYSATALEPTVCLFMDADAFQHVLLEQRAVSLRWLSSCAARLAHGQMRILQVLGRDLPAQVAKLLLDEAADGDLVLPQRTLAAMLGVHRPSLNKTLKAFERYGLIEVRHARIRLIDARGLEAIATR